jgi:hypothetical protein
LEAIADDGIVDETERPIFNASLASLQERGETITDIILYAAAQGIKKETAPVRREAASKTMTKPADILTLQTGECQ